MTIFGCIEEFDECSSNSFDEYIERLECFFHTNDIGYEAKKCSMLLSVHVAKTYSTLCSVLALMQPSAVTYASITSSATKESRPESYVHYAAQMHASAHKMVTTTENQKHHKTCYRCDGQHIPQACEFSTAVYHYCKKRGHIACVCLTKTRQGIDKDTASTTAGQRTLLLMNSKMSTLFTTPPPKEKRGAKAIFAHCDSKQTITHNGSGFGSCMILD